MCSGLPPPHSRAGRSIEQKRVGAQMENAAPWMHGDLWTTTGSFQNNRSTLRERKRRAAKSGGAPWGQPGADRRECAPCRVCVIYNGGEALCINSSRSRVSGACVRVILLICNNQGTKTVAQGVVCVCVCVSVCDFAALEGWAVVKGLGALPRCNTACCGSDDG